MLPSAVPSTEIHVHDQGGAARLVRIASSPFSIGRSETASLPLPHDRMLSRLHFVLEWSGGAWQVRDLGSRNGTCVNGEPLHEARPLRSRDSITAGGIVITFEPHDKPAARPAPSPLEFIEEKNGQSSPTSTIILSLDAVAPATHAADQSVRRMESLIKAGKEIAGFRSLAELFEVILDLSLHAVEASRGVLMVYERGELVSRAHRGDGFQLSSAVRDRVLQEGASLLVRDAALDSQFSASASIVQQRVRSLMAVPLKTDTQVTGLLYIDSPDVLRSYDADDLSLLTVLANIAAIRIEHARLLEVEQAERLMQRELDQAAEIQRGLLPRSLPELPGVELAGYSAPCKLVGGDYYDYFPLPEGRIAVVVADVAGKGLSAALLMSNLQARVQALMETESDIARLVGRLNVGIRPRTPDNKFITAFFAIFDPETGDLTYTNAGHNPPLLVRGDGPVELLTVGGPVLGIIPHVSFQSGQTVLAPGDTLVMYSDGVSEAPNAAGGEFGEDTVSRIAANCCGRSASETLREISAALQQHLGALPAADDVTLLVLRRTA